ncbi:MAG: sulfatase [Verrucomicrobiales bacterium]|nr:sulfatase [Verrucomicrobiales bacterium]|tara:strand:+ start:4711 stop:6078 length:1368 start_codon:yes stop_codon:yes gene_type:complete
MHEPLPINRRDALKTLGAGMGSIGLAGTLGAAPGATIGAHFPARAKRVIHLFMNGGPFGPDFMDPKPALQKYAGQRPEGVNLRTERPTGGLLSVPFNYDRHGQSGLEISDALPLTSRHADDICVMRSLYTDNPNHGPALLLMNNGTMTPKVPSMGAWMSYGLGSENENLPGYIVLCPGKPVRFSILWNSAFLPSKHAGTYINHSKLDPKQMIPWLHNGVLEAKQQRKQLDLLQSLNAEHLAARGGADQALEGRIAAMETAYRMQFAATDAFDINREPETVRNAYGKGHFANGCLLARRLAERGVRFTQVYYGNSQPWDTHRNHDPSTRKLALAIDQPVHALLSDLKQRGMLDDTLVIWGGEFGRTPVSENGNGRDHNPHGFMYWMAGGGTRGGYAYGNTDDFGFKAVEKRMHHHDYHATLLHLMGIDHERLTFRHAGRDYRLTDVHGHVAQEVLA